MIQMIKYTLKIWGACAGITFLSLFPFIFILGITRNGTVAIIAGIVTFFLMMISIGCETALPEDALRRYFPFFLPVALVLSSLLFDLLRDWAPLLLGDNGWVAYMPFYTVMGIVFLGGAGLLTIGARVADKPKALSWKRFMLMPAVLAALFLLVIGLDAYHTTHTLRQGGNGERVTEEISLEAYAPFSEDNQLAKADFSASFAISENYPRLDGATAAYPVYSAMTETIYMGLDAETVKNYVKCNRTDGAFERLIAGEADIIFGVRPSQAQLDAAREAGIELIPVKVSHEAFVFFVNTENTVTDISVEQIQKIYTREITDWGELLGKKGVILPYQRAENSGSQTIMENVVMQGTKMTEPLLNESISLMGGMIGEVESYRGYSGAIGYSFRYYATVMNSSDRLRILSINGIHPTIENIRSGEYPFTVDVYAYTTESAMENSNTKALINWIVSKEGQRLIELCGYVPVA